MALKMLSQVKGGGWLDRLSNVKVYFSSFVLGLWS